MKKMFLLTVMVIISLGAAHAKGITLISPNGGEILTSGTPLVITWTYSGFNGNEQVLIALEGATDYGPIAYSTISKGSLSWLAGQKMDGSFATPAADYRIIIEVRDSDESFDLSDAAFTIAAPASIVALMAPNGGEMLEMGKPFDINWSCAGAGGYVSLTLFKDNQPLGPIAENLPAAGLRYTWPVGAQLLNAIPYPPGNSYSIQIQWHPQPFAGTTSLGKNPAKAAAVGTQKTDDRSDAMFAIGIGKIKKLDPGRKDDRN
jgi:hypothetical protein